MRYICLDTETTGLDPKTGHRIVEIACMEMINLVKTGQNFHCYINPERDVPIEAFKIHNLSTEFLQDKPLFSEIANDFLDFIANDTIIIHNAGFDVKFLDFELERIGLRKISQNKIIDSLQIARSKFPGSPASLDALCRRFNIDNSKRTYHGALIDTDLLCDVYIELMGGAQKGFGFNQNGEAKQNDKIIIDTIDNNKEIRQARDFLLTNEEITNHQEFIKKFLKKNYWGYTKT